MSSTNSIQSKVSSRRTLGAAIGAAVAASICCVGPLVLIALGASGAWMSSLTFLEPIKPLLTLATGGFLGFAFSRVYAKSSEPEACVPGSLCADPRTDRVNKAALWGVALLVSGLLMVPSIVGWADGSNNEPAGSAATAQALAAAPVAQDRERVVLSIENMTCAACPHNVRKALEALDGVNVIDVTSNPPQAVVEFNPAKVQVDDLTKATTDIGYPSAAVNS